MIHEPIVEIIDRHTRLNGACSVLRFNPIKRGAMLRDIDDDGLADTLPGKACAPTTRQAGYAVRAANTEDAWDLIDRPGHNDTKWRDLIDRRVGRVEPPRVRIEMNDRTGVPEIRDEFLCRGGHDKLKGQLRIPDSP
jgi:hypothetical protein